MARENNIASATGRCSEVDGEDGDHQYGHGPHQKQTELCHAAFEFGRDVGVGEPCRQPGELRVTPGQDDQRPGGAAHHVVPAKSLPSTDFSAGKDSPVRADSST
jgi:hypothetical protein